MNKSTPINQLPIGGGANPSFVNEQQKQMITQAQQAIGSMNLPQNTQISDIATEDDATIQEVLNQINSNGTGGGQQQMPQQMMPQEIPVQQLAAMQQAAYQQQQQSYNQQAYPPSYASQQVQQIDLTPLYAMQQAAMSAPPPSTGVVSSLDQFVSMFAEDIKIALLVFTAVVIAHFVPLESFLGKYFAIDKIPYHNVFLRALTAAVLVLLAKRFFTAK